MVDEKLPTVSVIMPVRNEASYIVSNLEALLLQDYPLELLEITIADGMSDDGTREIIYDFINENYGWSADLKEKMNGRLPQIKVIDNPEKIMPAGANKAIKIANGELIFLMGGHVILSNDYIKKCVKFLMESDADCVGGLLLSTGRDYTGNAIALAMSSIFGVGNSGFRTASPKTEPTLTDTVSFCVYRKKVFDKIGMFNEKMVRHQDYELNYRLRKADGHIYLLPSAKVTYFVRSSIKKLCKQYWEYGIWKGRLVRKHLDSIKLRHLIPPMYVLTIVITGILSFFFKLASLLLVITATTYLVFIFAAMISFIFSKKLKYLPMLTFILPSLHFSWGLGFWRGLVMTKLP